MSTGKHVLIPRDYVTDRGYAISAACSHGGDGQCDGFFDTGNYANRECNCQCHTQTRGAYADAQTLAQMEAAHAAHWYIPPAMGVDTSRKTR